MADRVRRPKQFSSFLEELRENEIFKTYKEALIFAACLGFNRSKKVPFVDVDESIRLEVFNKDFDHMVINALAIADTNDAYVISKSREDDRIRIFEEYACGGLEIMYNEIAQSQLELSEGLVQLILREKDSGTFLEEFKTIGESETVLG